MISSTKSRTSSKTAKSSKTKSTRPLRENAIDLEHYIPAYFTFIGNKLARGASNHYLKTYGVGIETWRIMVMLAIEGRVTAQRVCQVIGMDKASASRTFKTMHGKSLIEFSSDDLDGRLRYAAFTPKGRKMHDSIMRFALHREEAFLSVLQPQEVDTLRDLLHRLHDNLPMVEAASDVFMEEQLESVERSASGVRNKSGKKS
jgi:DNA-binding MarR family transcriptional regulator